MFSDAKVSASFQSVLLVGVAPLPGPDGDGTAGPSPPGPFHVPGSCGWPYHTRPAAWLLPVRRAWWLAGRGEPAGAAHVDAANLAVGGTAQRRALFQVVG